MFCPQCGNTIKEGAQFCDNCGWAVPVTAVHTAAVPIEKKCASCGTVLKDEAHFCPNCGQAVTVVAVSAPVMFCQQCGNKLPEGALFCAQCGTAINKPSSVPNIQPLTGAFGGVTPEQIPQAGGVFSTPVSPAPVYNQTVIVPANNTSGVSSDNETILLKKIVSLVLDFDSDSLFTGFGQIEGNLNISTERILYKKSIFGDITGANGKQIKEISIPFIDIERVEMKKFNLIFPKIVIYVKSGGKIEFALIKGGKEAFSLIEQQIKIKSQ